MRIGNGVNGGLAMIYYEDNEIKIRDIIQEDISFLFICRLDKGVNRYDPRPVPQNSMELLEECDEYSKVFETEIINENNRKYKYFMITDSRDQPIGFVNFFDMDKIKKQGEMGVVIEDKRYWKKGIGTIAVRTAVNYILNNMDIDKIYIETGETNAPALGLFNKLGFKKCGEFLEDDDFKFIVMETTKAC
jgi:RimJ/RimL family protein N-acetyltransferase